MSASQIDNNSEEKNHIKVNISRGPW